MDRRKFRKFLADEEEARVADIATNTAAERNFLATSDGPWLDMEREIWYAVQRRSGVQGMVESFVQEEIRLAVQKVKDRSGFSHTQSGGAMVGGPPVSSLSETVAAQSNNVVYAGNGQGNVSNVQECVNIAGEGGSEPSDNTSNVQESPFADPNVVESTADVVYFHGSGNPLSNFYPFTFQEKGVRFRSLEHYYQWRKIQFHLERAPPKDRAFLHRRAQEILDAGYAGRAKDRGKITEHVEWNDEVRVAVMKEALVIKWNLCKHFREKLMESEGKVLEHDVPGRGVNFWGVVQGHGLNVFGQLLMELREGRGTFQAAQQDATSQPQLVWFLSDSMTRGAKEEAEGVSHFVEAMTACAGKELESFVSSFGGASLRVLATKARGAAELLPRRPDYVVIMGGINSLQVDRHFDGVGFEREVRRIVQEMKMLYPGVPILMSGIVPRPEAMERADTVLGNRAITDFGKEVEWANSIIQRVCWDSSIGFVFQGGFVEKEGGVERPVPGIFRDRIHVSHDLGYLQLARNFVHSLLSQKN